MSLQGEFSLALQSKRERRTTFSQEVPQNKNAEDK